MVDGGWDPSAEDYDSMTVSQSKSHVNVSICLDTQNISCTAVLEPHYTLYTDLYPLCPLYTVPTFIPPLS
jgi:hypothetical protein